MRSAKDYTAVDYLSLSIAGIYAFKISVIFVYQMAAVSEPTSTKKKKKRTPDTIGQTASTISPHLVVAATDESVQLQTDYFNISTGRSRPVTMVFAKWTQTLDLSLSG